MIKEYYYSNHKFLAGKKKNIVNYLFNLIIKRRSAVILPCSLNDLAESSENLNLRKVYKKVDFNVTDGMPLVWFFTIKLKVLCERVYGPDLMLEILKKSQHTELKHFFYGSSGETLSKLEKYIIQLFPKIKIVGSISPPYRKLNLIEEAHYLHQIRTKKIDLLWVGLSSPKQVELAVRWKNFLPNTTILCVGAAFDFIADSKIKAPKLIQLLGLEWLFRLSTEPRRLYKRYLIKIPSFLIRTLISYL